MGGVGQATALMLKQSCWFEEVALNDIKSSKGLAIELNHIDTNSVATSHDGASGTKTALKGADIVLITAGSHRKIGMTRQDLFLSNAKIVAILSRECAIHAPNACICLITNPINSVLPIACEAFKRINRCVDPCKMFGVTTLDVIRANTYVAEVLQMAPETVEVPVICGHSASTMVPILSHTKPKTELNTEEVVKISRAIQNAGEEVLKAKNNTGASTLGMAFAGTRFAVSLAKGLLGHDNVVECAYVMSNLIPDICYFSTQLQFGPTGVQKNLGIPDLSNFECCLLETAIPFMKKDIEFGEQFAAEMAKQGLLTRKKA
ncbi:malate dehydrogenase, mitochondrial-like isoform X2 [Rhodnius prolixus]